MRETSDVNGSSQFLPTIAIHQMSQDHFQCHAMQWIIGLGVVHAAILYTNSLLLFTSQVSLDPFQLDEPGRDYKKDAESVTVF